MQVPAKFRLNLLENYLKGSNENELPNAEVYPANTTLMALIGIVAHTKALHASHAVTQAALHRNPSETVVEHSSTRIMIAFMVKFQRIAKRSFIYLSFFVRCSVQTEKVLTLQTKHKN